MSDQDFILALFFSALVFALLAMAWAAEFVLQRKPWWAAAAGTLSLAALAIVNVIGTALPASVAHIVGTTP